MLSVQFVTWRALLRARFSALQVSLDELLMPGEGMPAEGEKKGLPAWAIVLIVLAVLLCCLPFCVIVFLRMFGPAIGMVFSNIIEELGTPVP
jgi:hypothetical protein